MKTTESNHHYQPETLAEFDRLAACAPDTVSLRDARAGMRHGEPLLVMMDLAIRYAKTYRARFDQPIGDDYMARSEFAGIISGIRGLLNFDGEMKMREDTIRPEGVPARLQDSKDNGMIESLFWTACEIAGIDGDRI